MLEPYDNDLHPTVQSILRNTELPHDSDTPKNKADRDSENAKRFAKFIKEEAFWNSQQVHIFMFMMLGVAIMTAVVYNYRRQGRRYEIAAVVFMFYEITLMVLFIGNFVRGLFL